MGAWNRPRRRRADRCTAYRGRRSSRDDAGRRPRRRPGSIHDLRRSRHDRMLGGVAAASRRATAGTRRSCGSRSWSPSRVRHRHPRVRRRVDRLPARGRRRHASPRSARRETGPLIGLILLGIGVLWLGGRLVPDGDLAEVIWPLTLIGGGIAVLVMRADAPAHRRGRSPPRPVRAGPPAADPHEPVMTPAARRPPAPARYAAATRRRRRVPGTRPSPGRPGRLQCRPARMRSRARRGRRRPRSFLRRPLTVSAVALPRRHRRAARQPRRDVDFDAEVAGAIALGIVGVGLVVSAWFGRARGLVPLAVLSRSGSSVVAVDRHADRRRHRRPRLPTRIGRAARRRVPPRDRLDDDRSA